jgi:hypothetical protein
LANDQRRRTNDSLPQSKSPPLFAAGFVIRKKENSVVARTCWLIFLRLQVLFEELHQAVDQPAPAPNHVETALVLVFLENMIQFVFELAHRNIPRFGLTTGRRPEVQVFSLEPGRSPKADIPTLILLKALNHWKL